MHDRRSRLANRFDCDQAGALARGSISAAPRSPEGRRGLSAKPTLVFHRELSHVAEAPAHGNPGDVLLALSRPHERLTQLAKAGHCANTRMGDTPRNGPGRA